MAESSGVNPVPLPLARYQPAAPARDWRDYRAMTGDGRDLSGFDVYVAALPEQRGSTLNLRYRW